MATLVSRLLARGDLSKYGGSESYPHSEDSSDATVWSGAGGVATAARER
jgi:hypothetical protein